MPVINGLSNEGFANLKAKLASTNDEVKDWKQINDLDGILTTKDLTLQYSYNPGTNQLAYVVGAKHSLAAKMAPADVIQKHIADLIDEYGAAIPASAEPGDDLVNDPTATDNQTVVTTGGIKVKPVIPVTGAVADADTNPTEPVESTEPVAQETQPQV